MLNSYFKFPVIEAAQLFSSGFCNLNCTYCYIPKTPLLNKIHKTILKKIHTGQFLIELQDLYGTDLTSISHWGTEPTLTIRQFKTFYNEAVKIFPKLKEISFSSNFMTNPSNLIKFVTKDLSTERPLEINIQVSIDGPSWITDKNRGLNTTKLITDNVIKATKEISSKNKIHKIHFHVKSTIGADDIKTLTNIDHLHEYYEFFDNFMTTWLDQIHDKQTTMSRVCDPTIVIPYNYTTEDGINFTKLIQNQVCLQQNKYKTISIPESSYYQRIKDKSIFFKEFFTKQKMFTCSAGDSMLALGDKSFQLHSCHRSFFMTHPEYEQETEKQQLNKITKNGNELERNQLLLQTNTCNSTDNFSVIKMLYNNRAINDFTKQKQSNCIAMIIELAKCGQISTCYTNENAAYLLSMLVQLNDCPMNNIIASGSSLIPSISVCRLFGNGTAENIFTRLLRRN
jgi:sulfatase maturation enzyme AslB (radical SAM superfamily)